MYLKEQSLHNGIQFALND